MSPPYLEFKRELPDRDGRVDPWLSGKQFSNYARDRLFREIVAFANAQGGMLILGVDETEDEPPRASALAALPRVHDLAARLEAAARACIDPPLPSLMIRGVPLDADGNGVVIFRTVASPYGPHRVASDGHAFVRRGASSVQMTMREIQDLTLELASRGDKLEQQMNERASEFYKWFRYSSAVEKGAFRVTAVPIGILPQSVRVAETLNANAMASRFPVMFGGTQTELVMPLRGNFRPILRGYRLYETDDDARALQLDVRDSGLVDLWFWHSSLDGGLHLHLGWILGGILTVHRIADWFRTVTSAPEWEFAIELALDGFSGVNAPPDQRIPLARLLIGTWSTGTIRPPRPPIRFPRLVARSRQDEEQIINLVGRDLLDAASDSSPWPGIKLMS